MKQIMIGLALFSSLVTLSTFANESAGGKIISDGITILNVSCVDSDISQNECSTFKLTRSFSTGDSQEYLFSREVLENFSTYYKKAMSRENTYLQRESEDLTFFGKLVYGWYGFSKAAILDAKYNSSVEQHLEYSQEILEFMTSKNNEGETRENNSEFSLVPLLKTLESVQ